MPSLEFFRINNGPGSRWRLEPQDPPRALYQTITTQPPTHRQNALLKALPPPVMPPRKGEISSLLDRVSNFKVENYIDSDQGVIEYLK